MPRRGLDPQQIARHAAHIVDRDGVDKLTLKAVADAAGVKPPSLYAHVKDLDDIRARVAELAYEDLYLTLAPAAVGFETDDAVVAIGIAYRTWARNHPGLYAIVEPSPPVDSPAAARVLELVLAVLRGYDFDEERTIHAARALRAAIHGFIALEAGGGFGLDVDVEASFAWMLAMIGGGIRLD